MLCKVLCFYKSIIYESIIYLEQDMEVASRYTSYKWIYLLLGMIMNVGGLV